MSIGPKPVLAVIWGIATVGVIVLVISLLIVEPGPPF